MAEAELGVTRGRWAISSIKPVSWTLSNSLELGPAFRRRVWPRPSLHQHFLWKMAVRSLYSPKQVNAGLYFPCLIRTNVYQSHLLCAKRQKEQRLLGAVGRRVWERRVIKYSTAGREDEGFAYLSDCYFAANWPSLSPATSLSFLLSDTEIER